MFGFLQVKPPTELNFVPLREALANPNDDLFFVTDERKEGAPAQLHLAFKVNIKHFILLFSLKMFLINVVFSIFQFNQPVQNLEQIIIIMQMIW